MKNIDENMQNEEIIENEENLEDKNFFVEKIEDYARKNPKQVFKIMIFLTILSLFVTAFQYFFSLLTD